MYAGFFKIKSIWGEKKAWSQGDGRKCLQNNYTELIPTAFLQRIFIF